MTFIIENQPYNKKKKKNGTTIHCRKKKIEKVLLGSEWIRKRCVFRMKDLTKS